MRHLLAALVMTTTLGAATPISAENGPVIVELFTSQGCSSCPPADEMLIDLAERPDVIALALHVDYWDYIGWKDEFASPEFTRRQHDYARAAGAQTVYTPQFVIGGRDFVVGAKGMELMEHINDHAADGSGVSLSARRNGSQIQITAQAQTATSSAMSVQLVRYRPRADVEIHRGENAGQTITYVNIVTKWQVLETWSGQGTLSLSADLIGDEPAVVIIQSAGPGLILAAAQVD